MRVPDGVAVLLRVRVHVSVGVPRAGFPVDGDFCPAGGEARGRFFEPWARVVRCVEGGQGGEGSAACGHGGEERGGYEGVEVVRCVGVVGSGFEAAQLFYYVLTYVLCHVGEEVGVELAWSDRGRVGVGHVGACGLFVALEEDVEFEQDLGQGRWEEVGVAG